MFKLSVANVVQKDFPECQEEEFFFSFQQKVQTPRLTCRNKREIGTCLSLKKSCKEIRDLSPRLVLNNSLCSTLLGHVPLKVGASFSWA